MKPAGPKGVYCYIAKGDCSKRCQTCAHWIAFPVAEGKEGWNCAFNWAASNGFVYAQRMDGLQRSFEGLRNHFAAFHSSILALVASVAGVRSQLSPSPPQALIEMEADRAPQLSDH